MKKQIKKQKNMKIKKKVNLHDNVTRFWGLFLIWFGAGLLLQAIYPNLNLGEGTMYTAMFLIIGELSGILKLKIIEK